MEKDGGRTTASITTTEDHRNQGGISTSRNALVVFIRQGDLMPVLLLKKWKVWWVTTCSIFFFGS
jgi:hypothetical protein